MIPKSVTPHRIQENFEATKVSLTAEEIARIVGIDMNYRLNSGIAAFLPEGCTIDEIFDVEADKKFVITK